MGSRDPVKPLRWAGSSRSGGETDPATKALQGFGGRSVLEIVAPMMATHGARSTRCGLRAPFTWCMRA